MRGAPNATQPGQDPFAAVIQPSEEAMTLLTRATGGLERRDYKLVIDSLQRIVELPGEHVLTSDHRVYESARRHAHRRIAALPPEGLSAYRLVHDGEASALYKQGLEAHDASKLRTVVDRFLCTSMGDRAAMTLAEWLIDEGRFAEAASVLQLVFGADGARGLYPDPHVPGWVVRARLAICVAGIGQKQRAEALLTAAASQPASTAPAETTEAGLGADAIAQRLTGVRAFVATLNSNVPATADRWPVAMGSPARTGRQEAVTPTLENHEPWRIRISPSLETVAVDDLINYAKLKRLLPVRSPVTDGRVIVIRTEDELLGLDSDSFSELWRARPRVEQAAATDEGNPFNAQIQRQIFINDGAGQNQNSLEARMVSNTLVARALHDYPGAGLSIAGGMACTVEWIADAPLPLNEIQARRFPGGIAGRDPFSSVRANRIATYSLKDGSPIWRSDASGTRQLNIAGTGPAETEYLAPPIEAEGYLVAPCRMNSDLFAMLLDPKSGKVVRQVYLCGTGGGAFDSLASLEPALSDGAIYFPTGRGLLVAVETSDWSVRWAVRYPGLAQGVYEGGWLPTAPAVVADAIVLAPNDSDAIFCFDRPSGQIRWQAARDDYSHLIAASDRGVWVGGKNVALLDLATGKPVWRRDTAAFSGRACLSGDRLYVPTFEGFLAFDAVSGEPLKLDLPTEVPTLGNLLAWQGSLYSVTPTTFQKYPDTVNGYKQALARHQADPADASKALQLASLELLRHQPVKAVEALAGLPATLKQANPTQFQSVVHLRVRAMIEAVASRALTGDAALAALREAKSIALKPEDAIETSLQLGDYLDRAGQPAEAARQYLSLALSAEGDVMRPQETGSGERFIRNVAVERIADLVKDLGDAGQQLLRARLGEYVTDAVRRHDPTALLWLAESEPLGEFSHRAELVLGTWAAAELRFEQAEAYCLRVLNRSQDQKLLAEAAARLAGLYLEADDLHQPVSAVQWLDRLGGEWGDVPVTRGVLEPESELSASQPAGDGATLTGREVSLALRKRVDRAALRNHQALMSPVAIGSLKDPSERRLQNSRPLCFRGDRTEPLSSVFMLLVEGNKIESHQVSDGKLLWPAELRLLGDLAVESQINAMTGINQARNDSATRARGVLGGQTMVVNTEYGLHAIGLLTGRRLWSRKFDPPAIGGDVAGSDAFLWAHDGYIVSIDAHQRLEVARLVQGDRVLWRTTKTGRQWAAVRARGPYVVAVDSALQQADIYQLADGRPTGVAQFEQDSDPRRRVNLSLFDDVICGPAAGKNGVISDVIGRDLKAPGVERWRISMPGPLGQVFKPTPDLLALADRTGLVRVIDPASGKQLLEARTARCGEGVADGAIVEGVFYVYGFQTRASDSNDVDKQKWTVAAIAMDSGRVLWEYGELGARTYLSDDLMRASSNAIPLFTFTPAGQPVGPGLKRADSGTLNQGAIETRVLDKKTGKVLSQLVKGVGSDGSASRVHSVEVWPTHIMVVTGSTYLRYKIEPPAAQGAAVKVRMQSLAEAETGGLR